MDPKIEEWNKVNHPLRIIDLKKQEVFDIGKKRIISKKKDVFYKCCSGGLLLLLFMIIFLFSFRTFYYELYNDITEVSNICKPLTNLTCEAPDVPSCPKNECNINITCPEIESINCFCEGGG